MHEAEVRGTTSQSLQWIQAAGRAKGGPQGPTNQGWNIVG